MDILLYTVLGTVIGTVIATVLITEGGASLTRLSRRIVERTVSELPEELPEQLRRRWSEEIRGDLETFARAPIRGLLFALKLRREGGRRLAAELTLQIALSARAARTRVGTRESAQDNAAVVDEWLENAYAKELKKYVDLADRQAEEKDEK